MSEETTEAVLQDAVTDEVITQEEVDEAQEDDLTLNIEESVSE